MKTVKYYLVGTKKIRDEFVAKTFSENTGLPIKEVFEEDDIIYSAEELDLILRKEQASDIIKKSRLLLPSDYQFIANNIDLFLNPDGKVDREEKLWDDHELTLRSAMKDQISTRALGCLRSRFAHFLEETYSNISDIPVRLFYEKIASLDFQISDAYRIRNMGPKSIQWVIEDARKYGIENLFVV